MAPVTQEEIIRCLLARAVELVEQCRRGEVLRIEDAEDWYERAKEAVAEC